MNLPSACPSCKLQECCTLKEVAVIAPARWWQLGRKVRRIIVAYLQKCPRCGCEFVVSERGTEEMRSPMPERDPREPETTPERRKRPDAPAWREPPPT